MNVVGCLLIVVCYLKQPTTNKQQTKMKKVKTFVTSIDWLNSLRYISWCVRSEPARVPRRNTASRRCPF
jgi:hypothetical protein